MSTVVGPEEEVVSKEQILFGAAFVFLGLKICHGNIPGQNDGVAICTKKHGIIEKKIKRITKK